MYFCVVLCIVCFVSFYVLFVLCRSPYCLCICELNYCHRVATQMQLNISHHLLLLYYYIILLLLHQSFKPGYLEIFVCIYDYTSCSNCVWCIYHRQTSKETADESQGIVASPISSVGFVCSTGSMKRSDYRLGSSIMMALY